MQKAILIIPDLHGRDTWKVAVDDFLNNYPDGVVVFLGDYTDSFDKTDKQILDNLVDVILYKERYPDNIILLLGNHDWEYFFPQSSAHCSGYRPSMGPSLRLLFAANQHLFQIAYGVGIRNLLFTHAGVSDLWASAHLETLRAIAETLPDGNKSSIHDVLNELFRKLPQLLYQVSRRNGGYHATDSPVWVRPEVLLNFLPENLTQIVGHTTFKEITMAEREDDSVAVIFTDVLGTRTQFMQILLDEENNQVTYTPLDY